MLRLPRAGYGVVRIDPLRFLTGWRKRRLNQALSSDRLQVIQNSLARAVVKAPKFCHVTPILKSLHWLKINERIEYKLISLT